MDSRTIQIIYISGAAYSITVVIFYIIAFIYIFCVAWFLLHLIMWKKDYSTTYVSLYHLFFCTQNVITSHPNGYHSPLICSCISMSWAQTTHHVPTICLPRHQICSSLFYVYSSSFPTFSLPSIEPCTKLSFHFIFVYYIFKIWSNERKNYKTIKSSVGPHLTLSALLMHNSLSWC